MPTDQPQAQLDWNEANLCKVLTEIYAKAAKDEAFYNKLMAEPYEVLNQRIKVPEDFHGKVYARQKNRKMFIMNVPAYGEMSKAGDAAPVSDYQILCTTLPW